MKQVPVILVLITLAFFASNCTSAKQKSTECKIKTASIDSTQELKDEQAAKTIVEEREPTDDEIREFGIIKEIEDGPYPFYVITVEFPERNFTASFDLNIEAISLNNEDLHELKGQYATIYYLSEAKLNLNELRYIGESLYGEYAQEIDPEWKIISGTLNGANEETPGDLPGTLTILTNTGEQFDFEEYVTSEMVKANGKNVVAYYSTKYSENITYLHASEQ